MTPAIADTLALLRRALTDHRFRVRSEADLQDQVALVLEAAAPQGLPGMAPLLRIDREVRVEGGRWDIAVLHDVEGETVRVVLELKVGGAASAVERQAQRYALMAAVDAVVVVTTSQRLATQLMAPGDVGQPPLPTLGGKPFAVIALRSW